MREILFRAKRVDNGEWVEGDLHIHCNKPHIHNINPLELGGKLRVQECILIDPSTVGQYTGLTDKNGKRIFEGDILQDDFGIGVVAWVTEHCAFICKSIENGSVTGYHYLQSSGRLTKTIIIGNIHDNPELLEVHHADV